LEKSVPQALWQKAEESRTRDYQEKVYTKISHAGANVGCEGLTRLT
jgi:hypothetical protein